MSEPRYETGWVPEEEFRRLNLAEDVHYRTIMRRTDGRVWCAPLGTPNPWPEAEADLWAAP